MKDITTIESAIGLSFHDRGLLWQALTHTTYARSLGLEFRLTVTGSVFEGQATWKIHCG